MVFFFFKQKTAYEMRISDWSSDVCSSDLEGWPRPLRLAGDGWWWQRIVAGADHEGVFQRIPTALHIGVGGGNILVCHVIADQGTRHTKLHIRLQMRIIAGVELRELRFVDRKSTRLNSSHSCASRMP